MRISFLLATAAAAISAQAASAQDITTQFRGIRVEGNVGGERFQSQGNHNDKFGYGASVGFDGSINDAVVVGAEGSYFHPNNGNENCSAGVIGGTVCHKTFEEFGVAARAGFLVTPDLLVFGKGGYAVAEQRKRFDAPVGETSFYNHGRTDGYQVGGGVEFSPSNISLPVPVYVSAQYVYANYNDHTATQRAMLGVGVKFK